MRPVANRCTAPPGTAYSRVTGAPTGEPAPPRSVHRAVIGVGSTENQDERSPNVERKLSPETLTSPFVPSTTRDHTRPLHCPFPSRPAPWSRRRVPTDE